ncbi:hypothetical protein [Humibacter sp. RRB41]|nr:hypothetical protein [Humibacter sp. RRB41]
MTYRVTWKRFDDDELHEREFVDVDNGYDFYGMMQRDANSYDATWERVGP